MLSLVVLLATINLRGLVLPADPAESTHFSLCPNTNGSSPWRISLGVARTMLSFEIYCESCENVSVAISASSTINSTKGVLLFYGANINQTPAGAASLRPSFLVSSLIISSAAILGNSCLFLDVTHRPGELSMVTNRTSLIGDVGPDASATVVFCSAESDPLLQCSAVGSNSSVGGPLSHVSCSQIPSDYITQWSFAVDFYNYSDLELCEAQTNNEVVSLSCNTTYSCLSGPPAMLSHQTTITRVYKVRLPSIRPVPLVLFGREAIIWIEVAHAPLLNVPLKFVATDGTELEPDTFNYTLRKLANSTQSRNISLFELRSDQWYSLVRRKITFCRLISGGRNLSCRLSLEVHAYYRHLGWVRGPPEQLIMEPLAYPSRISLNISCGFDYVKVNFIAEDWVEPTFPRHVSYALNLVPLGQAEKLVRHFSSNSSHVFLGLSQGVEYVVTGTMHLDSDTVQNTAPARCQTESLTMLEDIHLELAELNTTRVLLSWKSSASGLSDVQFKLVTVTWSPVSRGSQVLSDMWVTGSLHVELDVDPSQVFTWSMQACLRMSVCGSSSNSVLWHSKKPEHITGPSITAATNVSPFIVVLHWMPSSLPVGFFYGLRYRIAKPEMNNYDVINVHVTEVRLEGLKPFTEYIACVTDCTASWCGICGPTLTFVTEEAAPGPPSLLDFIQRGDCTELKWSAPQITQGVVRHYEVYLKTVRGHTVTKTLDNSTLIHLNLSFWADVNGFKVRGFTKEYGDWSPILPVSREESPLSRKWTLPLGIVLTLLIVVIIFLIFIYIRRRKAGSRFSVPDDEAGVMPNETDLLVMSSGKTSEPDNSPVLAYSRIPTDPTHPPITVEAFPEYVSSKKMDRCAKLVAEFHSFPQGQKYTWEVAMLPENKGKNRYANIATYDHSRVVLQKLPSKKHSDYINASYIDSHTKERCYIVTQGPYEAVFYDFWRMVWQEKSTVIVCLTKLVESHREKCQQYWPSSGSQDYGDIHVSFLEEDHTADYSIRTFNVRKEGNTENLHVLQFHFISWPDHGVPEYPTSLLSFRRRIRHVYRPESGPMVVHCSAGVGRTGCFILVDAMLERVERDRTIDLYNYMLYLRTRRIDMIQTEDQYKYVHDALIEALLCGQTEVSSQHLDDYIQQLQLRPDANLLSGMEEQFLKLLSVTPELKESDCIAARKPVNLPRNRDENILPKDNARVCLSTQTSEDSDYINAVFVDGYRQRRGFILTEHPLPETIPSFWSLIKDRNVNSIVMLNELVEDGEEFPKFWPQDENSKLNYAGLSVSLLSVEVKNKLVIRKLTLLTSGAKHPEEVLLFQLLEWPRQCVPSCLSSVLQLINAVEKNQQRLGNEPIVVMCSDGSARSGTFVAIHNSIERLKVEHLIDVFQCVRTIGIVRPSCVSNVRHYRMIYDMVQKYLSCFVDYANFKTATDIC